VDLGDARLNRRAIEVGARMAALPGATLPAQMGDLAGLKGVYRLLGNKKTSHEGLSLPHWEATREQAAREPVVLLVQDTSYLIYNHYAKTMRNLGQFTRAHCGLLLHSTLAVLPNADSNRTLIQFSHENRATSRTKTEPPARGDSHEN